MSNASNLSPIQGRSDQLHLIVTPKRAAQRELSVRKVKKGMPIHAYLITLIYVVPQARSLPGAAGQAHRKRIGEVSHTVAATTSTPLEPFWSVMGSSHQDCFEPDAQLRY